MAKVREIKSSKNSMPISIIALGSMEIVKGIPGFWVRPSFFISNFLSEMKNPFMEIIRFRIFGKEVSPKSAFDKPSDWFPFR
jgi:hypothetical protein